MRDRRGQQSYGVGARTPSVPHKPLPDSHQSKRLQQIRKGAMNHKQWEKQEQYKKRMEKESMSMKAEQIKGQKTKVEPDSGGTIIEVDHKKPKEQEIIKQMRGSTQPPYSNHNVRHYQPQRQVDKKQKELQEVKAGIIKKQQELLTSPLTKHQDKYDRNKYKSSSYPDGLPNIGNTCFLNSILQFIYGAAKYRDFLIAVASKANSLSWNSDGVIIIGKIFESLKTKAVDSQKYQLLKLLVYKLQHVSLFYQKYRQEDALDTLLNLLNDINDTLSYQKPNNMFLIQTQIKCRCMKQSYITSALYTSMEPETCSKCRQPFTKKIVNYPEYIIFTNNKDDIKKNTTIGKEEYQLVSQVCYMGSGRSGHYTCLRDQNGVTYQFNDSSVSEKKEEPSRSSGYTRGGQYGYNYGGNYGYSNGGHYGSSSFDRRPQLLLFLRKSTKHNQPIPIYRAQHINIKPTEFENYQWQQLSPSPKGKTGKKQPNESNPKKDYEEDSLKKGHDKHIKLGKKQKISHCVVLNQMYMAKIQAACKVFPGNRLGYKERDLYFCFVGSYHKYDFVIANGFNFFYYKDNNKSDLSEQILFKVKYHAFLKDIVAKIEDKLASYFKKEVCKVERNQQMAIITKDIQHSKISCEQFYDGAEEITYQSSLK